MCEKRDNMKITKNFIKGDNVLSRFIFNNNELCF